MKLIKPEKTTNWILLGIPLIFILGSIFHFLYELTGKLNLVALIAPINESIWEHTKLALVPMFCWWLLWYLLRGKKLNINKNNWFVASFTATIAVPILIVLFYYTYTGGFNIHSLAVDITSFFVSVAVAQLLGLYIYKHGNFTNTAYTGIIILIILLASIYIMLTLNPPHLPLFMDNNSGLYGLPK